MWRINSKEADRVIVHKIEQFEREFQNKLIIKITKRNFFLVWALNEKAEKEFGRFMKRNMPKNKPLLVRP
ncbi:MAG: hypothetical protein LR008_02470 [Candidatus Pacebacteria bacterium]|nr:hypothetical protein [Candidatus Paceibacterota bacterium]